VLSTRERLNGLKDCAFNYASCAKTFVKSKAIFKTNIRNIAQQGENEELNELLEKDEKMKSRAWFPGVVKTIGKYYLRVPRLFKKAYCCENSNGELCHIESSSWASDLSPSINQI
jgi:hypothetical protein